MTYNIIFIDRYLSKFPFCFTAHKIIKKKKEKKTFINLSYQQMFIQCQNKDREPSQHAVYSVKYDLSYPHMFIQCQNKTRETSQHALYSVKYDLSGMHINYLML